MNFETYIKLFEEIFAGKSSDTRYQDEKYIHFAKLNQARMERWQKTLQLNDELKKEIGKIDKNQTWIVITAHWCGDAAPFIPVVFQLAKQNPLIVLDIQLRDQEPFLIESYLTNGTKSIPKFIVRDELGKDLFVWGPRPLAAQKFINEQKALGLDPEVVKTELQNWYNKDKAIEIQKELLQLFKR